LTRRLVSSGSPFEAVAGYSRAVVQGDWCFVAGTTGYDYVTMTMPTDVRDQSRNALGTIAGALAEGGFTLRDVVRVTYYITPDVDWTAVSPVFGATFGDIRPAATCIVTGLVAPDMKVEIEVTAFRG
jgi:enamine deaminase RidA (YjgF/YER057c/UK114 family)